MTGRNTPRHTSDVSYSSIFLIVPFVMHLPPPQSQQHNFRANPVATGYPWQGCWADFDSNQSSNHPFDKYLLSTYSVPGTVLNVRFRVIGRSSHHRSYNPIGKQCTSPWRERTSNGSNLTTLWGKLKPGKGLGSTESRATILYGCSRKAQWQGLFEKMTQEETHAKVWWKNAAGKSRQNSKAVMCLACSNIVGCQYDRNQENRRKNCKRFDEK